jgi:hypothetical protein
VRSMDELGMSMEGNWYMTRIQYLASCNPWPWMSMCVMRGVLISCAYIIIRSNSVWGERGRDRLYPYSSGGDVRLSLILEVKGWYVTQRNLKHMMKGMFKVISSYSF